MFNVGRLVWNRLEYVKNPDTGRRVSRLNPEDERRIVEVPQSWRIVPQEASEAAELVPDSMASMPSWSASATPTGIGDRELPQRGDRAFPFR